MSSIPSTFDVIILGAGAAGLMAAIEAGKRSRRVLLLDHADRTGKKILISGGGRCNFTNLHCAPENYLSANPHFARSALARYTPADFIALVEHHRIPYHEKTLGQLFCDRTARDIVDLLEREAAAVHVGTQLEVTVHAVTRTAGSFTISTSAGPYTAASVVVATGGLSIPKMGATGFGYDLARSFGLRVLPPRPGLVPLTLAAAERDSWCDLSGVSAEAIVSILPAFSSGRRASSAPAFREKVLITHRGLSGPAILQASSYWSPGEALALDLAPGRAVFHSMTSTAARDPATAHALLRPILAARWAERWLATELASQATGRLLSNATLTRLEQRLHTWTVTPAASEGYSKAEVTVGGVDTAELDPRTLQSRRVPGLFFIGEVVDVTGWLGGYNFQWAWASGFAAGQVC